MALKTYTKEELADIIAKHGKWLCDESGGERANLRYSNLSYSNLSYSNLRYSNLSYSNLSYSNLSGSNLSGSDLSYSNLSGSNLSGSDLSYSDLSGSNLSGSDLHLAKNILPVVLDRLYIVPTSGAFEGWKKCRGGVIVRLLIPAKAKRSNGHGRKCRAEYVRVLEVIGARAGVSIHDGKTQYTKGKIVKCRKWCEDRWEECAGGIHFFITRSEAEAYS